VESYRGVCMRFRRYASLCVVACLAGTTSTLLGGSLAAAASHARRVPPSWNKARALVPATIRKTGVVSVATTASYPPYELYASNNKTIVGVDPDLGHAIGNVLGLKFEFHNVTYDAIPAEIKDGHYDVGMSAIGVFKFREKVVNFVDYATFGEAFLTAKTSSFKADDLSQVCGETIAAQSGTSESIQLGEQNKICISEHKKGVTSLTYPSENTAVLAVHSGRAPVLFADLATVDWVLKENPGQYRLLIVHDPKIKGLTGPYGIALAKSSKLLKPIESALKILIADGKYEKIFAKWGVKQDEIRTVEINHGVTTST
jgi:polar amino acid transport system substrate-binding protein